MSGKIGVGIITCNRQDFYEKCLLSVKNCSADVMVTVNDGKKYTNLKHKSGKIIQHKQNKGVGVSKNEALKYLIKQDCDHLFLIEDDIIIKDQNVFEKYIETARISGIWHLMFGYHGPANRGLESGGPPCPRLIVDYENDCKVAFNAHCVGAFCYYHKGVIKNAGLMDETYINAWEHVDHSYRIIKLGLLPAYWWFPDVANSYDYLDELACSDAMETCEIRKRPDWEQNMINGAKHFYIKHKIMPTAVPDTPGINIPPILKTIKERYSLSNVQSK